MSIRKAVYTSILILGLAGIAGEAAAQAANCDDGDRPNPWIGVHAFHCPGGSCRFLVIRRDEAEARFDFASEPRLRAIDTDGPGAGVLEEGDVLVAVNGYLITSSRGGQELANLPTGTAAALTLRRDDRLLEVSVVPEPRCETALVLMSGTNVVGISSIAMSEGRAEISGSGSAFGVEVAGGSGSSVGIGAGKQRGSLGLAFGCSQCSFSFSGDDDFAWVTAQFLVIEAVTSGGAGDLAGLEPGDVITGVNGHSIKSDEGARLFFRAARADELTIEYERDGEARTTVLRVQPDEWEVESSGLTVLSPDGGSDRLLGRLAVLSSGDRSDRLLTFNDNYISISGDSWGPSALGAVFSWCGDCRWAMDGGETRWEIAEYPTVESVTWGGAAEAAGLRVGDQLTHINGHDMKSVEAARLFLNARGGEEFEIRYRRGDDAMITVLRARDPDLD